MTVWLAMLGMGVVTFALRAAFLVLPEKKTFPGSCEGRCPSCRRRC